MLSAGEAEDARLFRLLAVLGGLNAAVGAYYYLRIVVKMYLWPAAAGATRPEGRPAWPTAAAVAACAGLSLLLGLFPAPLSIASRESGLAAISLPDPSTTATPPADAEPPAVADARPAR